MLPPFLRNLLFGHICMISFPQPTLAYLIQEMSKNKDMAPNLVPRLQWTKKPNPSSAFGLPFY